MGLLVLLLTQVLGSQHSNTDLLIISTEDGSLHGLDLINGSSLWSIPTGPPLLFYSSAIEPIDFRVNQAGEIIYVDSLDGSTHKLSLNLFEMERLGPLILDPHTELIFYCVKNTKYLKIRPEKANYQIHDYIKDTCQNIPQYSQGIYILKAEYTLLVISQQENNVLWSANYSVFTSLKSISTVNFTITLDNNTISIHPLDSPDWSIQYKSPVMGMHLLKDGALYDLNLIQHPMKQELFYLPFFLPFLLTVMLAGFYFGKSYASPKPIKDPPVEVQCEKPFPMCSAPARSLSIATKPSSEEGILLKYMKDNSYQGEYNQNSASNCEVRSFTLEENSSNHDFLYNDDFALDSNGNEYPPGEFAHIIEVLDNGSYSKKFKIKRILGKKRSKEIHLAKHKLDDQLYAIKIIRIVLSEKDTLTNNALMKEVNLIKRLQSKYVVRYITCWAEYKEHSFLERFDLENSKEKVMPVYLHVQMDYCNDITLKKWISQRKKLPMDPWKIYSLFYQLLKGVQNIHKNGIKHCCIKSENIFIDNQDNLKIGDFELSVTNSTSDFNESSKSLRLNLKIYSPSELTAEKISHKVDIFSLGIILLELTYSCETDMEVITHLSAFNACRSTHGTTQSQLISLMTNEDPELRPEASEILSSTLMSKWKSEALQVRSG